jgi:hypothetical protein
MTPLIFFLVLAIILGFAVGILIGMFIGNRRSAPAPEFIQADEETSQEPLPAIATTSQTSGVNNDNFQSLLHLWRDNESQELAADIDGRFHVKPHTIPQEERQQLCTLADEWRQWLCEPGDITLTSSLSEESEPKETKEEEGSPRRRGDAEVDLMPFDTEIEPLVDEKPVVKFSPLPASTSKKPAKEVKPEALSIVAQIDEILQEMLKRSTLEQRGIRLTENPDRGVVVWVGLEHYGGIDEVPMKDVQGILREAVAEWERRSELKGQTP